MTDAPNNLPTPPAYTPPAAPAPASQPGRTLGIVALILAIVAAPIGLILGIVALVQSKKAGAKNGLALAAIIVGAVLTVLWIITVIASIALAMTAVSDPASLLCSSLEPGTYTVDGTTFTCE